MAAGCEVFAHSVWVTVEKMLDSGTFGGSCASDRELGKQLIVRLSHFFSLSPIKQVKRAFADAFYEMCRLSCAVLMRYQSSAMTNPSRPFSNLATHPPLVPD